MPRPGPGISPSSKENKVGGVRKKGSFSPLRAPLSPLLNNQDSLAFRRHGLLNPSKTSPLGRTCTGESLLAKVECNPPPTVEEGFFTFASAGNTNQEKRIRQSLLGKDRSHPGRKKIGGAGRGSSQSSRLKTSSKNKEDLLPKPSLLKDAYKSPKPLWNQSFFNENSLHRQHPPRGSAAAINRRSKDGTGKMQSRPYLDPINEPLSITPPMQHTSSPEMACKRQGALPLADDCFGVANISVKDRRKCKPRGVLTVGYPGDFESLQSSGSSRNSSVIVTESLQIIPAPAEASVEWTAKGNFPNTMDFDTGHSDFASCSVDLCRMSFQRLSISMSAKCGGNFQEEEENGSEVCNSSGNGAGFSNVTTMSDLDFDWEASLTQSLRSSFCTEASLVIQSESSMHNLDEEEQQANVESKRSSLLSQSSATRLNVGESESFSYDDGMYQGVMEQYHEHQQNSIYPNKNEAPTLFTTPKWLSLTEGTARNYDDGAYKDFCMHFNPEFFLQQPFALAASGEDIQGSSDDFEGNPQQFFVVTERRKEEAITEIVTATNLQPSRSRLNESCSCIVNRDFCETETKPQSLSVVSTQMANFPCLQSPNLLPCSSVNRSKCMVQYPSAKEIWIPDRSAVAAAYLIVSALLVSHVFHRSASLSKDS